jgi:hypothetical protein
MLTAEGISANDRFGDAVGLTGDGTTAFVGASGDLSDSRGGAVYVYELADDSWSLQEIITPDTEINWRAKFGQSLTVADDANIALIGAYDAEAAFVFSESDGSWNQQAQLNPDDGSDGDQFGYSVTLTADGTTALIGARHDTEPNGDESGSTYAFTAHEGDWSQQAKLAADDGDVDDRFGAAVSIDNTGSVALIGASTDEDSAGSEDSAYAGGGTAYVFTNSDGSWRQQTKFVVDELERVDNFGGAVELTSDGSTAYIGAPGYGATERAAGTVFVFSQTGSGWERQAELTASEPQEGGLFAWSIAISGDDSTALFGAYEQDSEEVPATGAVYVFE